EEAPVLVSDAVQMDVPATETAAVETPAAGLTFESATPVTEETPVARTDSSSLLDFSSMTALSVAPAIEEAPVLVSDAVQMDVPATETAAVETPATEVSNSSFGFDSFASAPETPAIEVQASVAVETARQVTDSLDPEAILLSSISQLESVVESKESARDAEMARTENLNAQIAELKKQAKESQERAREIDAGADRARSLIANLKTQIQTAA
ncbi:MAG: hypothetical protein QG650_809, partial [Patescibacteria group bacterium]|nr:hypothetical protein [Patescibacteria group bacterium]